MSEPQVEHRMKATRVRSLGDATPIYRAGESTARKAAGEKTYGEIDKTMTERLAEMRDAAEMTTRCAIDGCSWVHVGPAGEARQVALTHRMTTHPTIEKGVRRCTTPGCTGRAVRGIAQCGSCASVARRKRATVSAMRSRALTRNGVSLLEEAASATDGDVGAASSSSTLDSLTGVNPEPHVEASARASGPAREATTSTSAAVTARTSSGETPASTPTERARMARTYTHWSRQLMIDRIREVAAEVGHTPTVAELRKRKLSSLVTPRQLAKYGFDSYLDVVTAAGLSPAAASPPPHAAPPSPLEPAPMAEPSLATLAHELEAARVDLEAASGRYIAALAAFKQHDVVQAIASAEGVAA